MYLGQYCIESELGQGEVELTFTLLSVQCFGLGEGGEQVVGMRLLLSGELNCGGVSVCHAVETKLVELIHSGLIVH